MTTLSTTEIKKVRKKEYNYFSKNKRDLPWRKTTDPYSILVSEIMLQQTQVSTVVPKYQAFIAKFPDFRSLASASFSEVLRAWKGLGYNRRALMLQKLAVDVTERYDGKLPSSIENLMKLPGIGKATASSILAFAFNKPVVFIETNIRTVFIHHFFKNRKEVKDEEIVPLVEKTLDRKNPRKWYSALMDYGSYLKKEYTNPSRKSKHYIKQKPFEGSDRQIRGLILELLLKKPYTTTEIFKKIKEKRIKNKNKVVKIIKDLEEEEFIASKNKKYRINY